MKLNISFDLNNKAPIYLQIVHEISYAIKIGILSPGAKLPGSRIIAQELNLHRKTVVAALDELVAQGWLIAKPNVGTYVNEHFPTIHLKKEELQEQDLSEKSNSVIAKRTSYATPNNYLFDNISAVPSNTQLLLNRGIPDQTLLPKIDWSKRFKKSNQNGNQYYKINENRKKYSSQKWQLYFEEIKQLKINTNEFATTDHLYQSLQIVTQYLWTKPMKIVVPEMGDEQINGFLQAFNHQLIPINILEEQIWLEKLTNLVKATSIDAIILQPDFGYPNTSVISINKRLHLIELANKYHFKIIEIFKDHDFSFGIHLPPAILALDQYGSTIAIGDVEHLLGQETPISYILAPANLITQIEKYKRLISPQSTSFLADAFADAFANGTILKAIKKSSKIYENRLQNWLKFNTFNNNNWFKMRHVSGGLGIWMETNANLNLIQLKTALSTKNYYLPDELIFQSKKFAGIRLGYASIPENEIENLQNTLLEIAPWCIKDQTDTIIK